MIDFNKPIDRMNTYSTQWDYVEDRFHQANLLPFTISDMDIEYPQEIADALSNRLNHRVLGYSRWKHEDYRNSICSWYKRRLDCVVDTKWVYYSPSVIYTISKFIEMLSFKDDGILILTPSYNAFYDVIKNNNRKTITSELMDQDGIYEIDFDDFELKCKQSSIFILCNPHNPIGKAFREDELLKIIDICNRNGTAIISDDIHMDINYESKTLPILKYIDQITCDVVLCSSISKTFNVPSLSGSYVLIPDEELAIEFERITRYRDFVNSPAILNVIATITAYSDCDYWVDELLPHLKNNLLYVKQYLSENMNELTMQLPDSCYFAWINFEALGVSSAEFQQVLIEQAKVAIMPGSAYGECAEYYLRFNVGCSIDKVKDGLNRIKHAVEYIKNR